MRYIIQAQVVKMDGPWRTSAQIPTFFLDSDIQGIRDEEHAHAIAKKIIDPFGVCVGVFTSIAKEEP